MALGTIWVDADSCPRQLKDFLARSSARRQLRVCLVGNQPLKMEWTELFRFQRVATGPDAADLFIEEHLQPESDIVVTRDIPLAAKLVDKGGTVLNDRGVLYTQENVQARLLERNLKQELRELGLLSQKGRSYGDQEFRAFAAEIDKQIAKKL